MSLSVFYSFARQHFVASNTDSRVGFGTRLERDLKDSTEFKHLKGLPKGLVPLADKPLLSYWIDSILTFASLRTLSSNTFLVSIPNHDLHLTYELEL